MSTYEDMKALYDDIALDQVSSTLIIQPPYSAVTMAQYLLLAQERGIAWDKLIGTIMNCSITQYVGPTLQSNMAWFPYDLSVKVGYDVIEYVVPRVPRWNIININAYNMRETGIDAVQEAAFSMALAADYIKGLVKRGLDVDSFAHRMAFFSCAHVDLLEEVAKLRAMRRIWARMLKEKFRAKNQRSMTWRTAIQTAALPLTAQQPSNNIVQGHHPDTGGGACGHAVDPHDRIRRGLLAAHRREPQALGSYPADHRLREQGGQQRRPSRAAPTLSSG